MAEKDDKSEKHTRTTVGIGNTELDRETRTKSDSSYGDRPGREGAAYRDRDDRYDRDPNRDDSYQAGGYEDEDDYQDRARRGARDVGDSLRDTGRTVRREGTDIISAGCDFVSGIFIGIGEAISPRRRGGSSYGGGTCGEVTACGGERGSASYDDGGAETTYRGRTRSARDNSGARESGSARVSTSRTEVRRTSSR